jgi:hypothetical protein
MTKSVGTKKTRDIEHVDVVGQPITVGRHVVISRNKIMIVCLVVKLSPRRVHLKPLKGIKELIFLIPPEQIVLLQESDMIVYLLRNAGK